MIAMVLNWNLKARFDSAALESGIKRIVVRVLKERPEYQSKSDDELADTLLKENNPKCKVYVKGPTSERDYGGITDRRKLRDRNKRVYARQDDNPSKLRVR